jgi:hypothetical protein
VKKLLTFATRYGGNDKRKKRKRLADERFEIMETTGKQLRRKKSFKKIKKKFASVKKFPTFAVPNKTGVNERSSES